MGDNRAVVLPEPGVSSRNAEPYVTRVRSNSPGNRSTFQAESDTVGIIAVSNGKHTPVRLREPDYHSTSQMTDLAARDLVG